MKIGIIGSAGRLGLTLATYLSSNNLTVRCSSKKCDEETIEDSDFSILCVPSDQAIEIISNTNYPERCIEVTAVKSVMLSLSQKFISIHPLFGSKTIMNNKFRNIIFVKDLSFPGSEKTVNTLFPGFNVVSMTADEHDRFMLSQLVLPYIVSIMQQGFPEPLTFSATLLNHVKHIISDESRQVVSDILTKNPHVKELVDRFGEIVKNPSW